MHWDVQINFGFSGKRVNSRTNINRLPISNVSCVVVLWGLYQGLEPGDK